jgi:CheY-like chemotaxis protein
MNGQTPSDALCILVVDDDIDSLHLFSMLLRRAGHTVHVSQSALKAIELIEAIHPDIVFLDLAMPDVDGFEVAKQVRRHPRFTETTVVAVTGYDGAAFRERARYAGFNKYLVKPVPIAEIETVVETVRQALLGSGHETHPHC